MTTDRPPVPNGPRRLRAYAEEQLRNRAAPASPRGEADALRLLHELEVHQVELEIQNAELEKAHSELERALARYTDLYDFAPVGYFSLDGTGVLTSANLAGASLLGVPRTRLVGRRLESFLSPDSRAVLASLLARTLAGAQREVCEVTLLPRVGEARVARLEAAASPAGNECRIAVLDITEQRAAETATRERTAQLEAANDELEAFSYSVSHDLRAPLRAISGFSQALVEDFGLQLPPVGEDYLRRIRTGAQRMALLIDDLLRLSRIGRTDLEAADVDLAPRCREILSGLAASSPGRHVETHVAERIPVHGDPRLLDVMLENLLGNAWKFTEKTQEARIEVGLGSEAEDQVELFVRDNGAGFDMACVRKLFRPFQRLHPADQYPGTGVGLAVVARIARRHGGAVRAEGAEGYGATFYVRLPTSGEHLP